MWDMMSNGDIPSRLSVLGPPPHPIVFPLGGGGPKVTIVYHIRRAKEGKGKGNADAVEPEMSYILDLVSISMFSFPELILCLAIVNILIL